MSNIPTYFGPTLVVYKDVVLFSGGATGGVDKDGAPFGHRRQEKKTSGRQNIIAADKTTPPPEDLLVVGGLGGVGRSPDTKQSGPLQPGRDPWSGEIENEFNPAPRQGSRDHVHAPSLLPHKATDKYLIPFRQTGVELVNYDTQHWKRDEPLGPQRGWHLRADSLQRHDLHHAARLCLLHGGEVELGFCALASRDLRRSGDK